MQEFITTLRDSVKSIEQLIKPTLTDTKQFEHNSKNHERLESLLSFLNKIHKIHSLVGRRVYKHSKSFSYISIEEHDAMEDFDKSFNPVSPIPILLTEELVMEFCEKFTEYRIQYYTDALVNQPITCNSTSKLTNLKFEWKLEATQQLISQYKDFLSIYFKS